jgi:Asp-tRNA(Asn)/Glu-tRNA(Gln) amidotransferase A subunit family amidase
VQNSGRFFIAAREYKRAANSPATNVYRTPPGALWLHTDLRKPWCDVELTELSATEAAGRIATGQLTAEEYVGACLKRIAALDGKIHAFIHHDPADALAQARALDERRRSGQPTGPLHGLPVGIKDIFDTADYPTECGSAVLKGRRPDRDCTVVAKLRNAGAVIIGKTVTTECAYFHPGATRNPHDPERTPGGSSSGSAAAVAAGMIPLAIGTQTNCSMIRPASFCGVFGNKPTHGLVSRAGVLLLSRSLDHVGVFARNLADIALVMETIAGYDENDPDTRNLASTAFSETAREKPPASPKLAFVRTPVWDRADETTRTAFENLAKQLGGSVTSVDLPASDITAWDDHRAVMAVEMAYNLGSITDRGGEASSKMLRDLVAEGRAVSAPRYLTARDNARHYAAHIGEIFKQYDAILTPSAPGAAPKGTATGNPAFNSLWSLTGFPTVTLPLLKGEAGMPLGVQLAGAMGDDARLMRTANWLVERVRPRT